MSFLDRSNLSRQIPDSIFDLIVLDIFDFANSAIFGDFPMLITKLVNLIKIELYKYKLIDNFFTNIINLNHLQELDVLFNQLSGRITSRNQNFKGI